jgi:hypothetical protein
VVGGVVGGVAGAASGAITGLTCEQAEALENVTVKVLKTRNWDADFVGSVIACAGQAGGGVVNGDNHEATIEVQLTNFKLVQEAKDMISIRMEASMVLETEDDGKTKSDKPVTYVYTSENAQVDDWIQNDGARFSDEFNRAFADLSRQIARTLWGEAPAVKCEGETVPDMNQPPSKASSADSPKPSKNETVI